MNNLRAADQPRMVFIQDRVDGADIQRALAWSDATGEPLYVFGCCVVCKENLHAPKNWKGTMHWDNIWINEEGETMEWEWEWEWEWEKAYRK